MIKSEVMPWTRRAVFICSKCHKSFPEGSFQQDGNCGENLKTKLKSDLKGANLNTEIRVMTSSCLDVCEPQTQAVYIQDLKKLSSQILTIHPVADYADLYKLITDC